MELPGIGSDRGRTLVAVIAMLLTLAVPVAAHADILYTTGGGAAIVAAHDDGSDPTQILSVSQVPGMTSIDDPEATGTAASPALLFTGTTTAFDSSVYGECGGYPYTYTCSTNYNGIEATGLYALQSGTVTRLSAAASTCQCTTVSATPQPTADGQSFFYDQWGCAGEVAGGSYTCTSAIHEEANSGADTQFEPACSQVVSQHATPDPANGAVIAVDGCPSSGAELDVEGAQGAGVVPIATVSASGVNFEDPSWSPDGSRVIAYQGGGDETHNPGLYGYNPAAANSGALIMSAPLDPSGTGTTKYPYLFSDPRYVGAHTIMFTTDGNIDTIPASCSSCTFPGSASTLVTGGSEASWTAMLVDSATAFSGATAGGGSGGQGGGGTGAGSGGSGGTGGSGGSGGGPGGGKGTTPTTSPPAITALGLVRHTVTPKQGFTLLVRLATAGTVYVILARRQTKRVHGKRKTTFVILGEAHLTVGTKTTKFSFKRVNGHPLAPGAYRLVVFTKIGKRTSKLRQLTLTVRS